MDRIWSPWRAEHVERVAQTGDSYEAVFSRIGAEDRDEENFVIWRGKTVYVVLNLYPYNNGHLLIVPYRQVSRYIDLSKTEQQEIAGTIDSCIRWLDDALHPEGYNIGMNLGSAAGAGIPKHLHVHVVPRWSADSSFMLSTAQTRVIPESLVDTWSKLRAVVEEES